MTFSIDDIVEACVHTRNENARVRGVSPYVLVFGTHPRREIGAGEGGGDLNTDSIVASLLDSNSGYEAAVLLREAAGRAWLRHLTLEGIERAKASRPTPYRGPYYPGDIVQCYRRIKDGTHNRKTGEVGVRDKSGLTGQWIGPCEVLCVENASKEHLTERIIWLNYGGRLIMASPEQCRPLPIEAERARLILEKFEKEGQLYGPDAVRLIAERPEVKGIDIRGELPPDVEAEETEEAPTADEDMPLEEDLVQHDLRVPLAPIPETPASPAPDAPPPREPAEATPHRTRSRSPMAASSSAGVRIAEAPDTSRSRGPPVRTAVQKIVDAARRLDMDGVGTPASSSAVLGPYRRARQKTRAVPATPVATPLTKVPQTDDLATPSESAQQGVMRTDCVPTDATTGGVTTNNTTGDNGTVADDVFEVHHMADEWSENDSWSDGDYFPEVLSDADTDCELPDAWCHLSKEFVETPDHNYDRKALEIALTVDANEICEDMEFQMEAILDEALSEHCMAASTTVRKRSTEVRERHLTASEKKAFRTAKHREWGSWLDNRVIELIDKKLSDRIPSKQIMGSWWVLTWKSAKDYTERPGVDLEERQGLHRKANDHYQRRDPWPERRYLESFE